MHHIYLSVFTKPNSTLTFTSTSTSTPAMHIPTLLPLTLLLTPTTASVLFLLSTQPGGLGLSKSYMVNRWQCDTLVAPMDKNTSWAFVASGLANGCVLYE